MSLGVLGPVVFEVSADLVRTWGELRRTGSARWATHDVFSKKPASEFLGPGLEQISFSVRFDVAFGVTPSDELKRLREQRDQGNVLQFTVGGELIGDFILRSIDEEWRRTSRTGEVLVASASLALEEYA